MVLVLGLVLVWLRAEGPAAPLATEEPRKKGKEKKGRGRPGRQGALGRARVADERKTSRAPWGRQSNTPTAQRLLCRSTSGLGKSWMREGSLVGAGATPMHSLRFCVLRSAVSLQWAILSRSTRDGQVGQGCWDAGLNLNLTRGAGATDWPVPAARCHLTCRPPQQA